MTSLPFPTRPGSPAARRPQVVGHRGARGLMPENTLPSFLAALDAGVDAVELDVLLTREGVPVVWHDPLLLPEKLGPASAHLAGAAVRDLGVAELAAADVGGALLAEFPRQEARPGLGIATLEAVLTAIWTHPADAWVLLELKSFPQGPAGQGGHPDAAHSAPARDLARAACQVVADVAARLGLPGGGAGRVVVESFDWAALDAVADLAPHLPRAALAVPPGPGIHSPTVYPGSPWLGSTRLPGWAGAPGADGANAAAAADLANAADAAAAAAAAVAPEAVLDAVAATGARAITPFAGWLPTLADPAAWVRAAHDRGLAVLPWTVNEPEHMRALLAMGVDGLVTDVPDVLLAECGRF